MSGESTKEGLDDLKTQIIETNKGLYELSAEFKVLITELRHDREDRKRIEETVRIHREETSEENKELKRQIDELYKDHLPRLKAEQLTQREGVKWVLRGLLVLGIISSIIGTVLAVTLTYTDSGRTKQIIDSTMQSYDITKKAGK